MNLRERTVAGMLWTTAGYAAIRAIRFVGNIVIVRLVMLPDAFGVLGMAAVFSGLLGQFGDFGIGTALVQRQTEDEEFTQSAFWLNCVLAVVLCAAQFMVAPLIAIFFGVPEVRLLLQLGAFGYILGAGSNVQQNLLVRRMQYKQLSLVQAVQTLVQVGLLVALVSLGFTFWSYPIASLLQAPVTILMYFRFCSWRPRLVFRWEHARAIIRFGRNVVGSDLLGYTGNNLDYLLIGKLLGTASLGLYAFAYEQSMLVSNVLGSIVTRTLLPAYAQIKDNRARFEQAFLNTIGLVALLAAPMQVGQLVVADLYVPTVYGDHWRAAIIPFQLMLFYGLSRVIGAPGGTVLNAAGRPEVLFRWNLVVMPVFMIAIAFGSQYGIIGVASVISVIGFVGPWIFLSLVFRTVGWDLGRLARAVIPAFASSGIMAVVVALTRLLVFRVAAAEAQAIVLLACASLGTVAYVLTLHLLFPAKLREVLAIGWLATANFRIRLQAARQSEG